MIEREQTGAGLSNKLEQIRQVQRGRHSDEWDGQNRVATLEPAFYGLIKRCGLVQMVRGDLASRVEPLASLRLSRIQV
jgi:hypothetical protein